jgi:putative phage-type endonuclease
MIEQGSLEWRAQRCGKVTASRVSDIIARTQKGYGASRATYMGEIVAEMLTGVPSEGGFISAAMMHGTNTEPQARAAVEFVHDITVQVAGFVDHPTIPQSGASPDGFIGDGGLLEIKCPQTGTHIETLRGGKAPARYLTQIQWQLACTGRAYCLFASFDPRMPPNMQLFVQRIERDNGMIAELETEVMRFLAEARITVNELIATYGKVAEAA